MVLDAHATVKLPAANMLKYASDFITTSYFYRHRAIAIPPLLLGIVIAMPVSFLCPISSAGIYLLWSLAATCSIAIMALSIPQPSGTVRSSGGNVRTSVIIGEAAKSGPAAGHAHLGTQTDSKDLAKRGTQTAVEFDFDEKIKEAQSANELLPISPEIEAEIQKLRRPPDDELTDRARVVLRHLGIDDTESLQKYVRVALQVPFYQEDSGNCFAVSHLIRWQLDNPEIILKIISQLLLKGRCRIWGLRNVPNFMHAIVGTDGPCLPQELLEDSFADLYARRWDSGECDSLAPETQLIIEALHRLDVKFRRDDENSEIRDAYNGLLKEQSQYFVRTKFAPYASTKACEALSGESGITSFHTRMIIDHKKWDDDDFREKVKSAYGLADIFMNMFVGCKCSWYWDRDKDGFCINFPFIDFLKKCQFPSIIRSEIMKFLSGMPDCAIVKNDFVRLGAPGYVCCLFPKMANREFGQAEFTIANIKDARCALESILKLKHKWNLRPGSLVPAAFKTHLANAYVPEINSSADLRDGQFVKFLRTNYSIDKNIYICKSRGRYFFAAVDITWPIDILPLDPIAENNWSEEMIAYNPLFMKPSFEREPPLS
ncbi:MAG: hypothetical protein LBI34_02580 [Puniceicoccales bacterium]|jgi:hypothetical protein|nr:hypothetical protein [Puniceicoccales bacterium]